jgi:hypothetical protein
VADGLGRSREWTAASEDLVDGRGDFSPVLRGSADGEADCDAGDSGEQQEGGESARVGGGGEHGNADDEQS